MQQALAATYQHLRVGLDDRVAFLAAITGAQKRAARVGHAQKCAHPAAVLAHACGVGRAIVVAIAIERAEPAWPVAARSQAAVVALGRLIAARADRARDIRVLARHAEQRERDE